MFDDLFSKKEYEQAFGEEAEKIVNTVADYFENCKLSADSVGDVMKRVKDSIDKLSGGDQKFNDGILAGVALIAMISYGITLKKEQKETE